MTKLFSWGANNYGQLGQGKTSEANCIPTEIQIDNLNNLSNIEGGANHSFIIFNNGSVLWCGANGGNIKGETSSRFKKLSLLDQYHILKIKSMWDSSFAVTNKGMCFGWGSNTFGQLGLPSSKIEGLTPIKEKVIDVAVGLRHTLLCLEDGTVYSAGTGKNCQLGREFVVDDGFQLVIGLENVRAVACGMNHSLALTHDGKIYAWGANKFGQLGLNPDEVQCVKSPTVVQLPIESSIIKSAKLMSGWTHSALLTANGELLNWGRNNYGQLGDKTSDFRWHPTILNNYSFKDVVLGAEHNLGITGNNRLVTWGWNEHGSCGVDYDQECVLTPVESAVLHKPLKIGVGASQCFCVIE